MADLVTEPVVDHTEPVVDPVVDPVESTEPAVDPVEPKEPEKKEPESGASLISRIKAKVLGERAEANEESGAEIPDEFTAAARKMNWSDEDTTAFAADFTDEQLKEMIPSLLGEGSAKADDSSDKAGEEPKSETKEEKAENSQDDDRLTQALDRIAALEAEQEGRTEKSKEEEQASFNQRASDLFDKASEEFEVFGKTKDLPTFPHNGQVIPTSPQMKARLEVYGMAQQLKEAGMPGDKALEFSLNAFKGANLKVEATRNVIKGLKKREQTLGGKRVSHEATEAANLTGAQVVAEVKRRHGK